MAFISQIKLSDTTYDISAWELRGKPSSSAAPLNNPGDGRIKYYYNVSNGLDGNMPAANNANGILHLNTHGGEYSHQLGFSSDGNIYQRATNGSALSNSVAWKKILNSSNYTDYTVTKTGGGASGTWGINITGNAATATKLATARTISLTGEITGSGNFDGSGNVNINTNLNTYKLYNENSGLRWYHLQVNNSSNNGTAWYKMATVSNPSNYGTYEAHKFIGYYYQHNGNWEQEEIYKVPFQIILNMSN